jgi:hypothetical protein
MEIPESLPLFGWASRVRGHDDQRNRMENRLESNRERRACPFDRDSSQTSIPRGFFPYAIALEYMDIILLECIDSNQTEKNTDRSLSTCRIEDRGTGAGTRDAHASFFQVTQYNIHHRRHQCVIEGVVLGEGWDAEIL